VDDEELEEGDVDFAEVMADLDDEAYLGESTLAKLRSGDLDFIGDVEDEDEELEIDVDVDKEDESEEE